MSFHQIHQNSFFNRPFVNEPATILGTASDYDVRLEVADVAVGHIYWRVLGVHHLTPSENRGKRNIYVDIIDEQGNRIRDNNLRLAWGWEGQRADEESPPRAFDKSDSEPHTNLDVNLGQHIWIQVEGDGFASDRVHNLHTNHADEHGPRGETWNSIGHHSFYVLFQRTLKQIENDEDRHEDDEHEEEDGKPPTDPIDPIDPVDPDPDPILPGPPPLPDAGGNKLGFYLHVSTDQHNLWDSVRRVQPPAILIHADTANKMLLHEIRRFCAPDAFVIGRMFKDNHTQRQMLESTDPAGQGRTLADEILRYDFGLATERGDNGRLLIDAWMSLNEAVPGPNSDQFQQQPEETARLLRNYNLLQVAFRERLQEAGVEAVAFNFGAGNFSDILCGTNSEFRG